MTESEGAEGWKLLRELCADLVELRRGDHSAARLAMDRARLKLEEERSESAMEAKFEQWLKEPDVQKRLGLSQLTPEERARRMREILGLSAGRGGLSPEALTEIERAARFL